MALGKGTQMCLVTFHKKFVHKFTNVLFSEKERIKRAQLEEH
jgi:hypothetical protein